MFELKQFNTSKQALGRYVLEIAIDTRATKAPLWTKSNKWNACLQVRTVGTQAVHLRSECGQHRIIRGVDGTTVAAGEEELCDGGQDEHLGLGTNLVQPGVHVGHRAAVEDLGRLHNLAGGHVQSSHITSNILITNNGEQTTNRHRKELNEET